MFAVLAGRPVRPMGLLYVTLAWIAAQAAVLFWGRALSRRALRDPAYMEKRFDGVVNTAVTADFTPYGLGVIVLNSKKR